MIYALLDDEGELIGMVTNIERDAIVEAGRKVDNSFRRHIDKGPFETIPERICEDLGIPFNDTLTDWADVLVEYLCTCGATNVEHVKVSVIPD